MATFGLQGLRRPFAPEEEEEEDVVAQLESLDQDAPMETEVRAPRMPAGRPAPEPRVRGAWRSEALRRSQEMDDRANFGADMVRNAGRIFSGGEMTWSKPGHAANLKDRMGLDEKLELDDPNSENSVAVRELVRRSMPEVAAQMGPVFERLSYAKAQQLFPFLKEEIGNIRAGKKLEAERLDAERKRKQQLADADLEFQRRMKLRSMDPGPDPRATHLRDLQIRKLEGEVGQQQKGRPLPAGDAAQLGGLVAAQGELKKLHTAFRSDTDWLSGVTRFFPNTDARRFGTKAAVANQVIGKILEGGKLAEGDLARYKAMMPLASDSDATAQAKVDTLVSMIEADRLGRIQGLGQAGFDVSGFVPVSPQPAAGGWTDADEARLRELEAKAGAQ